MQLSVIINADAGSLSGAKPRLSREEIATAFEEAGLYPNINYVPGAELAAAVEMAVQNNPDVLCVGGGDGTLSTAAAKLIGKKIRFAPLPLGTLNHFCKDLGYSTEFVEVAKSIAQGRTLRVDVGQVNGRVFLNNCSLGAYPAAVRRRDLLRRNHGHAKGIAMVLASVTVMTHLRRLRASLDVDGEQIQRRTPFVLISNNRYQARLFSGNMREHLDEGKLWVYTTRVVRFLPLLRIAFMALLGRLDDADEFEAWSGKELAVSLPMETLSAGLDGEVVSFDSPLRFRILPSALEVVVPSIRK
jgi:diacylglycerol kinase family enzyme